MPNKDMAKTAKRMYFCSFKEQYTFKKKQVHIPPRTVITKTARKPKLRIS